MAGLSLSDIHSQETEAVEAVARCYVSTFINIELDLSVYIYNIYVHIHPCMHAPIHSYIDLNTYYLHTYIGTHIHP